MACVVGRSAMSAMAAQGIALPAFLNLAGLVAASNFHVVRVERRSWLTLCWLGLALGLNFFLNKAARHSNNSHILPSPRRTIDRPPEAPYPPDAFPGARDVSSPYGSLRVYEWGPDDGRKVVLIHGISTPCISLGRVAHGFAEMGCRVMLLDLWGRGYSDAPINLPHDARLYTTSILLALTSSPLSWTGTSQFSLIGYSLGGGIATSFTSYFPTPVSSLILLAPSGLVRKDHFDAWSSSMYCSKIFPDAILNHLVRRRLGSEPSKVTADGTDESLAGNDLTVEVVSSREPSFDEAVLSNSRPDVTVGKVMHGPIAEQHETWRRIGRQLTLNKIAVTTQNRDHRLKPDQVLIILGKKDPIIVEEALVADATECLGADNVQFEFIDVGHELPITHGEEVVDIIWAFWNLER
ncbi:hypothetical protein MMC22_010077 [Lobaria immixta]|nr:hypothetical protein [Lobaria immixta]